MAEIAATEGPTSLDRQRRRWLSPFFAFGPSEFESLLQQLGVQPGDVVIVHCSFDRFEGFQGSLGDAMHALQHAVGSDGGLLMPTLPFSGLAVDYAARNAVLDVRRTPSHMGIMSEIFRRLPGVSRSLHPTHPVAGWGAKAPHVLDTHRSARTPCGAGSPFEKLVEADGKVLLLGVDVRSMTFFHYLEEELEGQMPFTPFTTRDVCVIRTRRARSDLAGRDASLRSGRRPAARRQESWSRS